MVIKKKEVIGWREWISLSDLKVDRIKAKIDTGARSSSLHAFNLKIKSFKNHDYALFEIHPEQRSIKNTVKCRTRILEFRKIKSSNGQTELRPIILTKIIILGLEYEIEISLTNRSEMGFRMLLGRESFRKHFLVDASKSFYGEKKKEKKKRRRSL